MGMDRRKFISLAAVAAVGLAKGDTALAQGVTGESRKAPLVGKRWAMAIDLKTGNEAKDCFDCINACNKVHNVPRFDNAKDEVKWIWKEHFGNAFHAQEHGYSHDRPGPRGIAGRRGINRDVAGVEPDRVGSLGVGHTHRHHDRQQYQAH